MFLLFAIRVIIVTFDPAPRPFDVAIAGAGLAGGLLALLLARRGMRVAVVDPGRFPRDKVCGEFLSPECWGVFERAGLAAEVEGSGYHPIRLVRISTPRGREVVAEVAGPDGRPGIALSRRTLDDRILALAEGAGATAFQATRAGGPIVEAGRVVGIQARGPGGPVAIRARITVAADGRHSGLVKASGRTRPLSWSRPRLFGLKRHLRVLEPAAAERPGTVGLHLVRGGYGGTCRIEGEGITNLCALLPERAVAARRGDLDRVAAECLGRNPILARLWASSEPAGDWKAVANVRVQVSTPDLPGILYAGDAQGTVDPLGGQGMTMALLGAERLVRSVELGFVSPGGVDAAIQRDAQRDWHRRFDRRVALCRGFHHALVHPTLLDLASGLGRGGPALIAACFRLTRDPERTPA